MKKVKNSRVAGLTCGSDSHSKKDAVSREKMLIVGPSNSQIRKQVTGFIPLRTHRSISQCEGCFDLNFNIFILVCVSLLAQTTNS